MCSYVQLPYFLSYLSLKLSLLDGDFFPQTFTWPRPVTNISTTYSTLVAVNLALPPPRTGHNGQGVRRGDVYLYSRSRVQLLPITELWNSTSG